MLTPEYLEHCADDAIKTSSQLEEFIIKDIARRIVQAGVMTETARHQIKALQESGYLYNDIIKEIANITNMSEEVVQATFEDAAIETLSFDDKIYKLAGLKPNVWNESPRMIQILQTGINKANGDINNLIRTTAGMAQSKFIELSNMAYRQYTSGAFDYNTAIFNAVEQLSKEGINVQYPSGKMDKIDVAVRRAVLTGVNQTANALQDKRAEELGTDLVEVTAHVGARVTKKQDWTNHAWWQGKVYSISGTSSKYPPLSVTGYGKVDGLGGINCRHNKIPFIDGISKRAYTDQELEELNNKSVMYNGQKIGEYEALKMQRQKEREIREIKRNLSAYQGVMQAAENEKLFNEAENRFNIASRKLKNKEAELKDFINQTGLKRNNERERVAGFNKSLSKKVSNNVIKQENYKDVTNEIIKKEPQEYTIYEQQYFIDENGNRYDVDGKNVVLEPTDREKEVANMLGEIYGGDIRIIPRVNEPSNIKTPDYMIENEKFDLKQITGIGKYVIEGNLKGNKKQANNFIIDITKTELDRAIAEKQIESIYSSVRYSWVNKIFLIKENSIIKVFKRK